MARLQVGQAADDYQWLPDLLILDKASDIATKSTTQFIYTNSRGDTVTVNGAGFAYSGNKATAGTISSVVVTNITGTLMTIDQLNDPLKQFVDRVLGGDAFAAISRLFRGNGDQLLGSDESDALGGFSAGNDIVDGEGGNDHILADAGNDQMTGGGGDWNTLAYTMTYFDKSAKNGVKLNVAKGKAKDPWGGNDTFSNFNSYWGSSLNDKFIGSSQRDEFLGLKGKDVFNGKGEEDRVDYSWDSSSLFPKGKKGIYADLKKGTIKDGYGDTDKVKSIEAVRGTKYKDIFIGGKANEQFEGLAGKDRYDGGKGFDMLSFEANDFKDGKTGVIVNMATGKVLNDGYGNKEKFKSIEVVVGTKFADRLIGSNKDDQLKGQDGNDLMTGGKGADQFVFNPPPNSTTNRDVITDFNPGEGDKIVLGVPSSFPGLSGVDGKLAGTEFVANAGGDATTDAHRVVYDTTSGKLYWDADGNGPGAKVLIVTLQGAPTITANAFEVWT